MKRRLTCMILALMLVVSLLPVGAIHTSAASSWNYSENVVNLIKQFEGFSASAYWDVNQWTIGYGTTGYAGQTISEAEADLVLRDRLNTINTSINQFAASRNLYLSQYQHDALVSFCFNCGTDWMTQGGRFYNAVVSGAGVNEFLFAICLWANAGSTPDANLINRRLAEANLYLNGVYSKAAPAAYTYVILDPNGGTAGSNGEDKMQGYLSGSNVNILAANPAKAGATFGGWFTAPSGGSGVKYLSSATAGRTLYAQYGTPVTVTSTYANVRNGAGTNYTQVGTVSNGTQLVIVETALVNGSTWGRYIDGWICLDYTNYAQGGNTGSTNTGSTGGSSTSGTAINSGTVVCNTSVNVRAGAGTQYQMVGTAYNGQRLSIYEIVSVNGTNWGRIGDNRWICLTYVKLDSSINNIGNGNIIWDNGNGSTSGGSSSSTTYTLGTVTASGLNIRAAAGVGNPIVGALKKGDVVKIYGQYTTNNTLWAKINVGESTEGWVCMNYISVQTNSGSGSNGTAIATGVVKANTNLNVRSGAGTSAPKIGTISAGTAVSIYEKVSVNGMEWGRIGTNQWVCLAYVTLNTSTGGTIPSTPSTPAGTGTGTVVCSTTLNVRSGAGSNFNKVGSLTPGATVNILEVVTVGTQQWGRIGTNQWVCMTYIRMNGSSGNTGTTIPSTGVTGKVVSSTALNVRAAAGTNNAIVAKLTPGTQITIYELTSVNGVSWGRTTNGWVCMSYVQLSGSGNVVWQ